MALFCQCSKTDNNSADGYGSKYPKTRGAYAIIDSCMSFMETDPARSHHVIDSVCNAKLMSPLRCNIAISENHYLETLKYARRGIAICHGHKLMCNDEASLMSRVGEAEQMLGRTKEAEETYAKANELLKEDNTFGGLIARFSLMMRQASLHSSAKDYDKAIAVCHEILAIAEHFDRYPSFVAQRPETMLKPGSATRDFADYYESQLYCKIARAYRQKIEQGLSKDTKADLDSVNKYLDKWRQTKSHETPINLANALYELYFTGRKAEFNDAKETVAGIFKSDSIVNDYADYLTILAKDAADRHDYQESNAYLHRALAISDSIRRQETVRTLSEQMSINMVQEQQFARQEAENMASRHRLLNWFLSAIIILIITAGVIIFIQKRRNKEKEIIIEHTQQDLIETKEEVKVLIQKLEKSKEENANDSMLTLYKRIMVLLKHDELYLNPDLDIKMLVDILGLSRTTISTALNTVTGKTFRTLLAEYRLELFLKLQKEKPYETMDNLLSRCGFKDQSTFRRQFKAIYGMTPSEYRKAKQNPK